MLDTNVSKKYFVTGTNTDVGKTVICSLLCQHLKFNYLKPIQTGNNETLDNNIISKLTDVKIYDNFYSLKAPASPYFASKCENIEIDINKITLPNDNLIVEGAGGCMVPINKNSTTLDLIKHLNIQTIIVVKNELGCVSSTLTTINALRSYNIEIAGVILNGFNDPLENAESIEKFGNVTILDKVKNINPLNKDNIKNYKLSDNLIKKLK